MRVDEGAARLETLEEAHPARNLTPTVERGGEEPPPPPVFYVDACVHPWRGKKWGHLMTTGSATDLITFAKSIGLNPQWIQKPGTDLVHFDVTPAVRQAAIDAGAIPSASIAMFRACVLTKRGQMRGNAEALLEVVAAIHEGKRDADPIEL